MVMAIIIMKIIKMIKILIIIIIPIMRMIRAKIKKMRREVEPNTRLASLLTRVLWIYES